MAPDERDGRLAALDLLVGEWIEQVELPEDTPGRCRFTWDLRGTVLLQRSFSPLPEFPDGLMVITPGPTRATSSTTSTPAASSGCIG